MGLRSVADNKTGKSAAKNVSKTSSYLEKLVSETQVLQVEELLELYKAYDELVTDYVFRHLLFPYTRFARAWLKDQARDILAGSDRNRIVLTSRFRKATEAEFEELPEEEKARWSENVKPRHTTFLKKVFGMLHKYQDYHEVPLKEDVEELGVSRLVYDDLGSYFNALMGIYPSLVADWVAAKGDGDHEEVQRIDSYMRALENTVGVKREDAWFVSINTKQVYNRVEQIVREVTLAYSRLLFRHARSLTGVTNIDENFSAGYEGMIRAARNYDPLDGSAFTSHCQRWVWSAIIHRQKDSGVIKLPSTTWYQLKLHDSGQTELSSSRVSDLRVRQEMFYAGSTLPRTSSSEEDLEPPSYETAHVTSTDAQAVLGDSILHAQYVEEAYTEHNNSSVSRDLLDEVIFLLQEQDPSLIFPLLVWSLNYGIDVTLLARSLAPYMIPDHVIQEEKQRHQANKQKIENLQKQRK